MKPEIYAIEYYIGGKPYVVHMPASSLDSADDIALALGGRVLGSDVHEVSAIPAADLMRLCESLALNEIVWREGAEDMLAGYLALGYEVNAEGYE